MPVNQPPTPPWTLRRATPSDREAALVLTRRAFGVVRPGDDRIWDWLFLENPAAAGMYYSVADAGNRLAAQYPAIPVRTQHEGKVVTGLLSLHTATDPDFERKGLFTALARHLYAETANEAPIVFGFPNTNVAGARYGKLSWVELRPYPLLVRPLGNLASALRGYRPRLAPLGAVADLMVPALSLATSLVERHASRGGKVVEFDSFGPWADTLWESLAPEMGTCVVRDAAYLNWRFVQSPFPYRRFAFERDGRVVGFIVMRVAPWRESKLAYVMELMVAKDDRAAARALLAHLINAATDSGAAALYAIATKRHPHRPEMFRAGLLPLPSVAARHSFGVRVNGPGVVPNRLLHIDDWYLSPGDLDYV